MLQPSAPNSNLSSLICIASQTNVACSVKVRFCNMNARGRGYGNFAGILNIDLRSCDCQMKAPTTEDIAKVTEQDLISLKIILWVYKNLSQFNTWKENKNRHGGMYSRCKTLLNTPSRFLVFVEWEGVEVAAFPCRQFA